jgi:hypothetical protein
MSIEAQSVANDNNDRSLVSTIAEAIRRAVRGRLEETASFRQREAVALGVTNEALQLYLAGELQEIADGHGEEVMVEGRLFHRHQPGDVTYHSLNGGLRVRRWTYREVGVRNGPTCVPLELAAGIVERATPALAYSVAQGYAKAPMRSVEEDLRAAHREPPSRSTLERLAKAIGTQVEHVAKRTEQLVRISEVLPKEAVAISLGLDRTTVPMEEDLAPDETRKTKPRAKPRVRVAPSAIAVHYRMAYVGTVTLTDKHGETLVVRRYAASAHDGPHDILQRMMMDVRRARFVYPKLHLGIVQDNAPELWNLMREALVNQAGVFAAYEAVDRYHFMQHLTAALVVIGATDRAKAYHLARWRLMLDRSDTALDRIVTFFERWLHQHGNEKWVALDTALFRYVLTDWRFRYATQQRLGLHTGSGVTEGACKSLIAARAKRSGQRWRPTGIRAVLALRSLLESDRLPRFWNIFVARYTANVIAA